MLLTKHVLTGALLGTLIDDYMLLFPLAVGSHLVMDVIPHFGMPESLGDEGFRNKSFLLIGSLDFAASLVVVTAVCVAMPQRSGHILVGAFGAALPDLTYIPEIVFGKRIYRLFPWLKSLIYGFLGPIQRLERPWGVGVEWVWALAMISLLGVTR